MPTPKRYSNKIADESNNCVSGSVEGVKIAPIIVEIRIIYLQEFNICFTDTTFRKPNKI